MVEKTNHLRTNEKSLTVLQHGETQKKSSNSSPSRATLPFGPLKVQKDKRTRRTFVHYPSKVNLAHRLEGQQVVLPTEPRPLYPNGRNADMLRWLIGVGPKGLTKADLQPGLNVGEYIRKLRHNYGLVIEKRMEPNRGNHRGQHARYILHSKVTEVCS